MLTTFELYHMFRYKLDMFRYIGYKLGMFRYIGYKLDMCRYITPHVTKICVYAVCY